MQECKYNFILRLKLSHLGFPRGGTAVAPKGFTLHVIVNELGTELTENSRMPYDCSATLFVPPFFNRSDCWIQDHTIARIF